MGAASGVSVRDKGGAPPPALVAAYAWQLYALLFKNAVLLARQRATLLTLVAMPALLVCVFGAILHASQRVTVDVSPPVLMALGDGAPSLVRCTVYDVRGGRFGLGMPIRGYPCVTIAFAPQSEAVVALMRKMAEQTGLRFEGDFRGFADRDALAQYFADPSRVHAVHAALVFNASLSRQHTVLDPTGASAGVEDVFPYELWYNHTAVRFTLSRNSGLDPLAEQTSLSSWARRGRVSQSGGSGYVLAVQHAVNAALVAVRVNPAASVDMKLRAFPFVQGPGFGINRDSIPVEQWGPLFYVLGMMTCFVTALTQVAQEKEARILGALRMMGLYESCYWLSWALHFAALSALGAGLVVAAGTAVQIPLFLRTDAGWLVGAFAVSFFSVYAFALAVSSVVPSARVAANVGFLLFFLVMVLQLLVCIGSTEIVALLYDPTYLSPLALRLVNMFPAVKFVKVGSLVTAITRTKLNSSGLAVFDRYTAQLAESSSAQFGSVDFMGEGLSLDSIVCRGSNLTSQQFAASNCFTSRVRGGAFCLSALEREPVNGNDNDASAQSAVDKCEVRTKCSEEWRVASAGDAFRFGPDGFWSQRNYSGPLVLPDPVCAPGMTVVRSDRRAQDPLGEPVNITVGLCSWTAEGCVAQGGLPTYVYERGVLERIECECAYSIESSNATLQGMLLNSLLSLVLAWYLGQVVTFGHGRGESPWFPLTPWFWIPGLTNPLRCRGSKPFHRAAPEDEDVLAEERAVARLDVEPDHDRPVVLRGLVKDFGNTRAVDGLTLSLRSGECFVLLGHNGAGKSTAINMLSGMTGLSGGDCVI